MHRNRERADEVARTFDIPAVFTDYHEMIDKGGLDAVVIATPEDLLYLSISGEKGRMDCIDSPKTGQVIEGVQLHEDEPRLLKIPNHFFEGMDRTKSSMELYMEVYKKQPHIGYAFVESILNNKVVPPSFYEGLKAQEIIDAAFCSHESDTLVTL